MEPSPEQRADLAQRIEHERITRFRGDRKAAYTAADVNSVTWSKAENGVRIAERSLVSIVNLLWPETGGDWRKMDPPLGAVDLEEQILNGPFSEKTKAYMLQLVREDRERAARQQPSSEMA